MKQSCQHTHPYRNRSKTQLLSVDFQLFIFNEQIHTNNEIISPANRIHINNRSFFNLYNG